MRAKTKVKAIAIVVLVVVNIAIIVFLQRKRGKVPVAMRTPTVRTPQVPLAQMTPEGRNQLVASAFALADFDIKDLAAESESVEIRRPKKWLEQMVLSMSYVNEGPAKVKDELRTKDSRLGDLKLSSQTRSKIKLTTITNSDYETAPTPRANVILVTERAICRDRHLTRNEVEVPLLELIAVGQYYVDKKEDTLVETKKALRINGEALSVLTASIPHWLVPKRALGIGETWVQVGALPEGAADTVPRPQVVRKLNRLVLFEGRRAAELSSSGISVESVLPGPGVQRKDVSLIYLDLKTGEPLWYESKSADDESESVLRGCNQIFTKHLLWTPKWTPHK